MKLSFRAFPSPLYHTTAENLKKAMAGKVHLLQHGDEAYMSLLDLCKEKTKTLFPNDNPKVSFFASSSEPDNFFDKNKVAVRNTIDEVSGAYSRPFGKLKKGAFRAGTAVPYLENLHPSRPFYFESDKALGLLPGLTVLCHPDMAFLPGRANAINPLSLYLYSKHLEDILTKGIQAIRNEMVYKKTIIYEFFKSADWLEPISLEKEQSLTIFRARSNRNLDALVTTLEQKKILIEPASHVLSISSYPAHSKEQVEMLLDHIDTWSKG